MAAVDAVARDRRRRGRADASPREAGGAAKRVFAGMARARPKPPRTLRGRRVLAFAGIGRPEKFFETLRAMRRAIVEIAQPFPIIIAYTRSARSRPSGRMAESRGLLPVTTEKDLARIAAVRTRTALAGPDGAAGAAPDRGRDRRSATCSCAASTSGGCAVASTSDGQRTCLATAHHHGLGRRIGLLPLDAPVLQLVERDCAGR